MSKKWGGSGDMNLPFEAVPGGMDLTVDVELASGVMILAAVVPHPDTREPQPILIFRFSRGDGSFYSDRALVAEEGELRALVPLVRSSTDAAIDEAHRRRKGNDGADHEPR